MQPNWDYVKKTTLWHYDDLIKKLNVVRAYPVIWQAYNHDMNQAADFARRLFPDKNIATGEFPADVFSYFRASKIHAGISNWGNLLSRVTTRAECLAFRYNEHKLNFKEFIDCTQLLTTLGISLPDGIP